MNYKLINKQTGEERICQKMVVDGWDYYVSDEKPIPCNPANVCMAHITKLCDKCGKYQGRKVIATNNPNIDIPKVVDEVDIAFESYQKQPKEFKKGITQWVSGFHFGYNKSQKTHSFSEEDMIEFAKYSIKNNFCKEENRYYQYWELLQLWKEQKPKTIWYE